MFIEPRDLYRAPIRATYIPLLTELINLKRNLYKHYALAGQKPFAREIGMAAVAASKQM